MSQHLEGLFRSQLDLYGRIARSLENLKKTSSNKLTLGMAEACLQAFETNWTKFENQNDKLMAVPIKTIVDQDYIKQNLSAVAEEVFLQQKDLFLDFIRQLKAREVPASNPANTTPMAPRTTLPRIQLQSFSGKYNDWPLFRDLFTSIIGKDSSTTQVEKLHYLKTCLKGEAELLIRNITTTSENYERAWKILSDYYENKRFLTRAYIANFLALAKLKNESAAEMRKVFHTIKATVTSPDGIGRAIGTNEDLFVHLCVELLDPRSRREWENAISDSAEPPSYSQLETFFAKRLHTLESIQPVKVDNTAIKSGDVVKAIRSHNLARKQEKRIDGKRGRCSLCQGDHILMFCEDYEKKTAVDRKQFIDSKDLCLNCLGRHKLSECASNKNCSACGSRHHSSVHDACRETEVTKTSHVAAQISIARPGSVLLATTRVRVADRYGRWQLTRALIDQGSESSIISERLAQRLKLTRSPASVSVYGVGGHKTGIAKGRVLLSIAPRSGGYVTPVSTLVLPELTLYAGGVKTALKPWTRIQGLELADPDYRSADRIDLLIGADVYSAILLPGLRRGGPNEPLAQRSTLGWILSGPVGDVASTDETRVFLCRTEENLDLAVCRFWEQEEVPSAATFLSPLDREYEEHFVQTHARQSNGRYIVRLPVISPLPDLSDTRRAAARMLRRMEARFARDGSFCALYNEFMVSYEELGHMAPIASTDYANARACYLPHHGVMRDASTTTKLRVVFNGSASSSSGLPGGPGGAKISGDPMLELREAGASLF